MSNRPFTFTIACARAKSKFKDEHGKTRYGCYPAGFLETARELLVQGDPEASIWHIPGGCADQYNGNYGGIQLHGYGKNDLRIDIDPKVQPDIIADVRNLRTWQVLEKTVHTGHGDRYRPDAIIIDRDYSKEDANNRDDPTTWPADLGELTRQCLRIVKPGRYVGVLDQISPNIDDEKYIQVFWVWIKMPGKNRPRLFTVWRAK